MNDNDLINSLPELPVLPAPAGTWERLQRRVRARRRQRALALCVPAVVLLASAGLLVNSRHDDEAPLATSTQAVLACKGDALLGQGRQVVVAGKVADLPERLQKAAGKVWTAAAAGPPCREDSAAPGPDPVYGGTLAGFVLAAFSTGRAVPLASVTIRLHDAATSRERARQRAQAGGPTQFIGSPGETLAPDLRFDNRLLREQATPRGGRAWAYRTLQTVFAVGWTPDGTTVEILAPLGPDQSPDDLASQSVSIIRNLIG